MHSTPTGTPQLRPVSDLGTVARTVAVMRALAEAEGAIAIKSLAARLDLPASTVHRLLHLLIDQGMAEQVDRYSYRTGTEFYRLGSLVAGKMSISEIARPFMQRVVDACDEYCLLCLYLPAERKIMVTETVNSSHPLRYVRDKFMPLSVAWGATGRAILAFLPEDEIRTIHAMGEPSPATGKSLPAYARFRADLDAVQRQGYAHSMGQKIPGAVGFAAPVFGPQRVIASLCATVPQLRYRAEDAKRIPRVLIEQARLLSRALGHLGVEEKPASRAGGRR